MISSRTLSAGDVIDSICTRCREVTNHTVVAMVGDRPARVECNTCGGVHNYRAPKPTRPAAASSPGKKAAPKSRRDPKAAEREEWSSLVSTLDHDKAVPYAMDRRYQEDDLLDHPAFGLGIVQRIVPPNKSEVLFESGKKLLRCG